MSDVRPKTITAMILSPFLALALVAEVASAKGDDFNSVVKTIEQFYGVKHVGIPFLAKAGIKAARTAAQIKGGDARRIAEAGSLKLAVFENQEFTGELIKFRSLLNSALTPAWSPLVQTLSATDEEQVYIFLREAGDKFNVLVITIEPRNATVVQATISPQNFLLLMKDPQGTGRAISEEATIIDQE